MARVPKTFFYRNQDWGQGTPSFTKKQIAEMCYLYRRTGHNIFASGLIYTNYQYES